MPSLFLFLTGLLGGATCGALVLGQIFLVNSQKPAESFYDFRVIASQVLGFADVLIQIE